MPKASPLAVLKPNPKNPRLPWAADQAAKFRASLEHFGDLSGVTLNQRSGQLVGGHKRVEEFKSDPKAHVVVTDKLKKPDATGTIAFGHCLAHGTRWAYRVVDWGPEKEAAANLAANQWGAEFDLPAVAEMLKGMPQANLDLTGFAFDEIERILAASVIPAENKSINEAAMANTENECPKCGFKW